MREYCFLNDIYMMGEMSEEWKNIIVTPTCGKQKWKTAEELACLLHVINYCKILK